MTRSLAAQVAALPKLSTPELIDRYEELHGHPAPIRRRDWLLKRVAWQTQAAALGGLSDAAQARLDGLMAQLPRPSTARPAASPVTGIRTPASLMPGTLISKDYKGERLTVRVLDEGFEYGGVTYPSLTAVARAVTGSKAINGRLFFGLTDRKRGR